MSATASTETFRPNSKETFGPDGPGANGSPSTDTLAPAPRNKLLARVTSLTTVASVAAAGMMIVGVLAVVGGTYDKQVVHDQLAPQKIFFPPKGSPALFSDLKQYAGQQVTTGAQAQAYANHFIARHLEKVAGGQTYAQVSAASIANPTNATLTAQKATLFQGETLRGLLLGAWGWASIGMIATLAGIILIALGALLFLLPLLNWQINLRGRPAAHGA